MKQETGRVLNIQPFLNHLRGQRHCTDQTLRAYGSDLELLYSFLVQESITNIHQVTHSVITKYIEHMQQKANPRFGKTKIGLSDASIARRLATLSSYFEFVRATGEDSSLCNPLKARCDRWRKNNEPKPVEEYTLDFLLANITVERDRALFYLFYATGLRISEMHPLDRDSIQLQDELNSAGAILCTTGCGEVTGKGGKKRTFYVDADTSEILFKYLVSRADNNPALFLSQRKQRMSVRAIQYTLDAWCRKLGYSHINVHRLRHSYATRLANANIDSMVLKDLMGHRSLSTTRGYFKLTDTTLARGYFAAMEYLGK